MMTGAGATTGGDMKVRAVLAARLDPPSRRASASSAHSSRATASAANAANERNHCIGNIGPSDRYTDDTPQHRTHRSLREHTYWYVMAVRRDLPQSVARARVAPRRVVMSGAWTNASAQTCSALLP